MVTPRAPAASGRVLRTHIPGRAAQIGISVREADKGLHLDGGGHGLLDTTHFDTVRFPPPDWALESFTAAANQGDLAYTPYRGHPEVLFSLAEKLSSTLSVPLSPDNFAITPGTQAGLFTTLASLIDDGDLVLVADPDYLFNERILAFLGARVRRIAVINDEQGTHLDTDAIAAACRDNPRLLVFSHPSNPTGAVYSRETLQRIAELAEIGDFRIVVDELYCRLIYDNVDFCHLVALPGMQDRCVTLLGPSKTESMSGYRLGVIVGPVDVLDGVESVLSAVSLRAPAYAEHLLRHWWSDDFDFVATRIKDLQNLRETTVSKLRGVPYLRAKPPNATAYLFPDVSALGLADQEVARRLQLDAGVIVSPGYQFGARGVGHFRVCYARDETVWESSLDRIAQVLTDLGRARGAC